MPSDFFRRLSYRTQRNRMDEDLRSEMQQHIELLTAGLVAQGKSADEARLIALRRFGNSLSLREESRESWGFPSLESFVQDIKFGVRLLVRSPGFTIVAVLTLALGIGANTAVFSSVNALLLRQLPYFEPNRLVTVTPPYYLPEAGYASFKERTRTIDLAGFWYSGLNLSGNGEATRLNGAAVSDNFFSVLGSQAWRGRVFQAGENSPGRDSVAILSYRLWQTRFASDPEIVGRVVSLDGVDREIVGVMPASFSFPNREIDVWVPIVFKDPDLWGVWVQMFGRLTRGATLEQARADVKSLAPQVVAKFPWPMPKRWSSDVDVVPIQNRLIGDLRSKLLLLLGAVGLVLLIACSNVANLLLARATSRQREIAVRGALGAGQGRIVRQLITESILLALLGGLAGLALAPAGMQLVRRMVPENELPVSGVSLDWRVLSFVAAAAMLTGILFGMAPALRARRVDLDQALRATSRTSMSRERRRASSSLVVIETSLAMVLAVSAGLLIRSLWQLSHESSGLSPDSLITASLTPSPTMCGPGFGNSRIQSASPCAPFYNSVLSRVEALPGVESAAYTAMVPYRDLRNTILAVQDNPQYSSNTPYQVILQIVSPGYFRTMRIALLAGRTFTDHDGPSSEGVVMVSRKLAERLWPGQNPIGKRVKPAWMNDWRTVVGMVKEVRSFGLPPGAWADADAGEVYFPTGQGLVGPPNELSLLVRTPNPAQIAAVIPKIVAQVNSTVPVTKIETMRQVVSQSNTSPRTVAWLFAAFSGIALVLSAIGIYSLISYSVTAQTQEIGIRMALGAERGELLRKVLSRGLTLAVAGVLIGAGAALGLTRLLRSLLYGIGPSDPLTFGSVAAVLLIVAVLAAYVPARRAASIDPMTALRYE